MVSWFTVGKNIICASKMREKKLWCHHNKGLFSEASCKVIAFNLLCFFFGIRSLHLFLIILSKVIALLTFALEMIDSGGTNNIFVDCILMMFTNAHDTTHIKTVHIYYWYYQIYKVLFW